MSTNDNLDSLSDAALSEAFAVEVAGYKDDPQFPELFWLDAEGWAQGKQTDDGEPVNEFATSADAVLVYLEARGRFNLSYFKGWSCQCLMGPAENQFGHAPTLARSICLALIRAKRAEKGQP